MGAANAVGVMITMSFKCGYQYESFLAIQDGKKICTLTGRKCFVDEDGGAQQCLRARWAKEFEAKHGTSIFGLGKRPPVDLTKSQELA